MSERSKDCYPNIASDFLSQNTGTEDMEICRFLTYKWLFEILAGILWSVIIESIIRDF